MSSILSQHENEKRFIWLIKSAYLYIRTEDDTILMPIKTKLLDGNMLERVMILLKSDNTVLISNIKIRDGDTEISLDPNIIIDTFFAFLGEQLDGYIQSIQRHHGRVKFFVKIIQKLKQEYKLEENEEKKRKKKKKLEKI